MNRNLQSVFVEFFQPTYISMLCDFQGSGAALNR